MLRWMRRGLWAIAGVCVAFSLGGCETEEGSGARYEITYKIVDDSAPNGIREIAFSGTAPRCRVNSSAPEGDPLRGKFFVGATTENSDGEVLIATIQFTGFTEAPPAGQYGGGDVNIFIQVQAGGEQLRPMGPDQTVTVTETGGSIRVTLDPSTVPAAGFIQCG